MAHRSHFHPKDGILQDARVGGGGMESPTCAHLHPALLVSFLEATNALSGLATPPLVWKIPEHAVTFIGAQRRKAGERSEP